MFSRRTLSPFGGFPLALSHPLALLGAIGLLWGVGHQEVRRFERLASEDIAGRLNGEKKRVEVRARLSGIIGGPLGQLDRVLIRARDFGTDGLPLFTEPEFSKRGSIQNLVLELDEFDLSGLRVESLRAAIPDCRFDYGLAVRRRQIRLSRSGEGTGRVRIREKDLEAFVLRKFREIKRVSIRIDQDKVIVEGYGEFLVVQTEFFVVANLEARDGKRLTLENARVLFDGQRVDEFSRKVLLDTLNPVVDLDADLKLYGAVHIEGLKLRDGVLEAWGRTRIPDRPKGSTNSALR